MMKSLKQIIQLLLLAIFITGYACSCKKYLDEKSDKTLVVPATLSDLQGMLDNDYTMNIKTSSIGQNSDDDFFMTPDKFNAVGDLDRYVYTWRPKEYNHPNDWAYGYNVVFNSNYCLDQLVKLELTAQNKTQWNNVNGSAHFFRAYSFLNLVWDFAKAYDKQTAGTDLGIALRLNADFNVPSVRATVKACYDQIIADLQQANADLPNNPYHPLRPSKAAACAALARTYLSMRVYDSAYKYSELALKIKKDMLDYNSSAVDPSSSVPFQSYNKEIIFYTQQSGVFQPVFSYASYTDTTLYKSYEDNDLRKTVFFFPQGGYHSFKGQYSANPYAFFSGITVPEMMLTKAECGARLGQWQAAMDDLNKLLPYRYVTGTFIPLSANTQAQAIAIVLQERRKELTMRGSRWIDIKRLNKEGANILLKRVVGTETFLLPPGDNRYALPLPKDIVDLTGMQQN
jgi:hypothetical protein